MTRRIVALFNTSTRMKDEGGGVTAETTLASPFCSIARAARGIYSCVDSGKLWSIKKQISNSIETARYKHYSACSAGFSSLLLPSYSVSSSIPKCFVRRIISFYLNTIFERSYVCTINNENNHESIGIIVETIAFSFNSFALFYFFKSIKTRVCRDVIDRF